jgi:hypothetical protein
MNPANPVYLLTIQGLLAPKTQAAARTVHNETAGHPANIAAAKSLGDLSHMVYSPMDPEFASAGNFLFLDVWNKLDGLNQFFANPTVQEQAAHIFSQRDPVVWEPADGFITYHLPAPYGKNERIVAMVRGFVHSRQAAKEYHNGLVGSMMGQVRMAGDMSHDVYFRLSPPDAPESLEFCAIDVWSDAAGMAQTYSNPDFLRSFGELFTAPPATSVWVHPEGDWVEW